MKAKSSAGTFTLDLIVVLSSVQEATRGGFHGHVGLVLILCQLWVGGCCSQQDRLSLQAFVLSLKFLSPSLRKLSPSY